MRRSLLQLSPEKTALFLFGVFFVVVLLLLALAVPSPTEAQWRIFNVVLALVAAAIGAILPGVLHLQFTPWLRASGALAVFAFVYLVKPAALVAKDPFQPLPPPPTVDSARPVIDRWLALLDRGDFAGAYEQTYPGFRSRYQRADFIRLGEQVRLPLGAVVARQEVGQQSQESMLGDRGYVRVYMFRTRFQNSHDLIDEFVSVFARDATTGWSAAGYNVNIPRSNSPIQSGTSATPAASTP